MTEINIKAARKGLAGLPEGTKHGASPALKHVYLPQSHMKAIDPNVPLVIGMRGAGKTFWWSALRDPTIRKLIDRSAKRSGLSRDTEVRTGFGVTPAPNDYPDKDMLRELMSNIEPRLIWRTVQARQVAPDNHPLRQKASWAKHVEYVKAQPEEVAHLFHERDAEFDRKGSYFVILFDALDRCADDWQDMYLAIRGLLQTALEMRSYQRLRVKVFLRSDQIDEAKIGNFPDASKILSSPVSLNWPRNELYSLLWHSLGNGENGVHFRRFLAQKRWDSLSLDGKRLYVVPRRLVFQEESQRNRFHELAGQRMGRDRRRGFPYTWIPNHLADTDGRVSPRSFLEALRTAAVETDNNHGTYKHALHYDSIKRGVQKASKIRVSELQEDYPWVDEALSSLSGMVVPCGFNEVARQWRSQGVLDRLRKEIIANVVKLPPLHIADGPKGIRRDLESLGVFQRMQDGRVNIPDVFRVGYGLGRKGGVKPVR